MQHAEQISDSFVQAMSHAALHNIWPNLKLYSKSHNQIAKFSHVQIRPKDDAEDIFELLMPSELAGRLVLRPFMQRNPYVVAADASMTRAYRLFRTMGLRHMLSAQQLPWPTSHPLYSAIPLLTSGILGIVVT